MSVRRVLGVFGLLLVAGGLAVLWNKAPAFYSGDNAAAASATTRAGILTAAAGLIAFAGVMLNVAETRRTNEQIRERDMLNVAEMRRANEQTQQRDRLAHQLDRQGQLTERFGRAADQIGSEQAAVRLAGVYAMAKLADDWADERQTCIDVLCAYLRMPYTPPPDPPAEPDGSLSPEQIEIAKQQALASRQQQQVRHTVIRIIASRLRPDARPGWQGHRFDLTGAVLDGGDLTSIEVKDGTTLDLSHATFCGGRVDFLATFSGGAASFAGAEFSGSWVTFDATKFSDGLVTFAGAEFSGGTVTFNATFSGATVNFLFAEFSGSRVNFNHAEFSGSRVNFDRAEFSGSMVSFHDARFSGGFVSFYDASFTGGLVDLSDSSDWSVPPEGLDGSPPGVALPAAGASSEDR